MNSDPEHQKNTKVLVCAKLEDALQRNCNILGKSYQIILSVLMGGGKMLFLHFFLKIKIRFENESA